MTAVFGPQIMGQTEQSNGSSPRCGHLLQPCAVAQCGRTTVASRWDQRLEKPVGKVMWEDPLNRFGKVVWINDQNYN